MTVDLQIDCQTPLPIEEAQIRQWATHTLNYFNHTGNLCICIVDETTMTELNGQYRQLHKPTNVLSFPSELPEAIQSELNILGDMIICPAVLAEEAVLLNKPLRDHWAHICVHGVLHLLGYDHIEDKDADIMQSLETDILKQLDIPNPYSETEGANIEH